MHIYHDMAHIPWMPPHTPCISHTTNNLPHLPPPTPLTIHTYYTCLLPLHPRTTYKHFPTYHIYAHHTHISHLPICPTHSHHTSILHSPPHTPYTCCVYLLTPLPSPYIHITTCHRYIHSKRSHVPLHEQHSKHVPHVPTLYTPHINIQTHTQVRTTYTSTLYAGHPTEAARATVALHHTALSQSACKAS